MLISFTPLKYYVPGLVPGGSRNQLRELLIESEKLSSSAESNERWAENIKKVLKGDLKSSSLEYEDVKDAKKDTIK